MVKIEDPDEAEQHENNSPMNSTPPQPPEQQPHPDSPDTVSSISSDHTFHGFSPIRDYIPSPSPSPSPICLASPAPPALPVANRFVRDQVESVTKTESDAQTGFAKPRVGGGYRGGVIGRRDELKRFKRAGLSLRVVEFVVCLVSFAVLAADRRCGWALDSFDHYIEFRYSLSVNVIGFAYSGLQGLDLLHQMATGKELSQSQFRYCFDFAMDQILAYLLLSASSSAFTRINDWISNWGQDKFPSMANASVGVSSIAFVAFALSSLISGYMLCKHRSI